MSVCWGGVFLTSYFLQKFSKRFKTNEVHRLTWYTLSVSFPVSVIKTLWQKQLKEERISFWSWFKLQPFTIEGNWGSRSLKQMVTWHLQTAEESDEWMSLLTSHSNSQSAESPAWGMLPPIVSLAPISRMKRIPCRLIHQPLGDPESCPIGNCY